MTERHSNPIEEGIYRIVAAQFGIARSSITAETNFEEMGADIYDVVTLAVSVEQAFGVVIPDQVVDTLLTVGDLIAVVKGGGQSVSPPISL